MAQPRGLVLAPATASTCARVAVAVPMCAACLADPPPFDACIVAFDYAFPWDRLITAWKFHQVLEHRWFMAENAGRGIPLAEAVQSYVTNVLSHRRDEQTYLNQTTESIVLPEAVPTGTIVAIDDEDTDWRDLV